VYIQQEGQIVVMDVSRGAAYGLGLSQFAIVLGIVLFFPGLAVDVYVPKGRLQNTTLTVNAEGVRAHMGMPVLGVSLLAAVFAMVTCKGHEQGLSEQDFQPDVVEQLGMWDLLFWVFSLAAHGIVGLVVCDPVDAFGAVSSTTFMAYFLYRACAPRSQNVNLTQENLNLLGYSLGVLQLAVQVTSTRDNGATVVMLVVVLDYFLGVGHTYDRQATIGTVSNCRLFYICAGTLGLGLLYAVGEPAQAS
jgi:hypothetical protein